MGQETVEKVEVYVQDIDNPEIKSSSADGWYTKINQTLTKFNPLAGMSAVDGNGKSLKISVQGTVNAQWPGVYTLTYSTADEFGITTSRERYVTVLEYGVPDFYGIDDVRFVENTVKTFDPRTGVSAKSGSGKTLEFTVEGSVDTTKAGEYTLVYKATDEFGHLNVENRTVEVTE